MDSIRSRKLPAGVWALGFVSLFMDISSEMIHSLLPAFLVTVVGASALAVGLIEGIAESTASLTKLFSGALSDHWRRRKPLALLGYGMAALTKPLFPLADSAATVLFARFADRIGKGIRAAPRDAMVADLTLPEQRGAAFGLRQSLDTVGAFLGPLLAIALMLSSGGDMRLVFWIAVIPAFIAVAVLWLAVHETPPQAHAHSRSPLAGFSWRSFPPQLWWLVGVVALFTLTRFSEAFLILRAHDAGWTLAHLPLVLVLMNLVYAASAYPFGKLSDHIPRQRLLALGCAVMVAADLCLAWGDGLIGVVAGVALWGLHMGLTEGLIAALVADYAPKPLVGTAFGVVNLARGITLFFASLVAGAMWTGIGSAATFLAGAAFAVMTIAAVLRPPRAPSPSS